MPLLSFCSGPHLLLFFILLLHYTSFIIYRSSHPPQSKPLLKSSKMVFNNHISKSSSPVSKRRTGSQSRRQSRHPVANIDTHKAMHETMEACQSLGRQIAETNDHANKLIEKVARQEYRNIEQVEFEQANYWSTSY